MKMQLKTGWTKVILLLVFSWATVCNTANAQAVNNKPANTAMPTGGTPNNPIDDYSGQPVNYIRTKEAIGKYTDITSFDNADYQNVKQSTQYFDGLGRPLQTVLKQATSGSSPVDLVSPVVYDEFGREVQKFMPYPATNSNGYFNPTPFSAYGANGVLSTQYNGEHFFYSQTEFEPSPLNRPTKTYAPGNSWVGSGVGVETQYLINSISDDVKIWDIGFSTDFDLNIPVINTLNNSYYEMGELYKNVMIDENGNKVVEFKDKEGKIILKKVEEKSTHVDVYDNWLCTYYIYDDLGQLRCVLQPKAVNLIKQNGWVITNDILNGLCFRYEYDERGRMAAKKIPGADWVYLIYDKRDRLIFTQDGNIRRSGEWLTNLYDELNRQIMTGMLGGYHTAGNSGYADYVLLKDWVESTSNTTSPVEYAIPSVNPYSLNIVLNSLQQNTLLYTAGNSIVWDHGFNTDNSTDLTATIAENPGATSSQGEVEVYNSPLPPGYNFYALTITHYDDYSFTNKSYNTDNNNELIAGQNLNAEPLLTATEQTYVFTKGMVTGTSVRTIPTHNDFVTGVWLNTVTYYDQRQRPLQVQSDNYLGGTDINTSMYDFSGKVLCSYSVHNNPQNPDLSLATIKIRTRTDYDHTGKPLQMYKQVNDIEKLISQFTYDQFGQLSKKELGKKDNSFLETQEYEYNVRGWLRGINKDYAKGTVNNRWFGMELNYDWGFDHNQLNGNISGTKWRGKGDGVQRAYGFTYDNLNRLLSAKFSQGTGSMYAYDTKVNFDMYMGHYNQTTGQLENAYDENGNILAMSQYGLKLNSSSLIDNLNYNYSPNSNQLKNVIDNVNDAATKLGDFRASSAYTNYLPTKNANTTIDYEYDENGNLRIDKNKDIAEINFSDRPAEPLGIKYNFLNLPDWIPFVKAFPINQSGNEKGFIKYVYDAAGTKLAKIVIDKGTANKTVTTTTYYINSFTYESKSVSPADLNQPEKTMQLQFVGQEEGRIRINKETVNSANVNVYVFDYFLKDHLGNIRAVLTDEEKEDIYPVASLENADAIGVENDFYTITGGHGTVENTPVSLLSGAQSSQNYQNNNTIASNNPAISATAISQKMYKLNGTGGGKTGFGMTLRVMSGDVINIYGNSYYEDVNAGDNTSNSLVPLTILSGFLNAGSAVSSTVHTNISPENLDGIPELHADVNNLLNDPNRASISGSRPRAYINYIIFDDNFNYKAGGFSSVAANANNVKYHHDDLPNIAIPQNGYIYIYCSNESPVNVYFDNLQVTHKRSSLIEETSYYPFGLIQQGISSKAAGMLENKQKFMGKEQQSKEFSDGSGLEWNDFGARMLDPQIGRWNHIDPKAENYMPVSPYSFTSNNPILFIDQDGKDVTPSTGFKSSSYYAMYQKLSTSNSVYKSYLAPFVDNKQMNYNLDAGSVKKAGDKALATTQPKDWNNDIKKDGFGIVTAINTTTTTWQVNEKADITMNGVTETKGINDAGRALVLLHEGAHAFLQSIAGDAFHTDMTNPIAGGEHDMMASGGYQKDILKGLTELRDAGGITMSDANLTNLSFYGLQGTDGFDKQFGITVTDRKSQEYADAVKKVYDDTLNPLIYTEKTTK